MVVSFRHAIVFVALVLGVVIFDQVTKEAILQALRPGDVIPIIPGFFNLVLTFNPGAAFGIFSGLPSGVREWVMGGAITIAITAVVRLFCVEYRTDPFAQGALMTILGGAIGNLIDRTVRGHVGVVDFLDFYYGAYHFPAFNVADSAITLGVAVLLFHAPREHNVHVKEDHIVHARDSE